MDFSGVPTSRVSNSHIDWSSLTVLCPSQSSLPLKVTIEATCPTGFEYVVKNEVKQRLNVADESAVICEGRVIFDIEYSALDIADRLLSLRCVDNLFVVFIVVQDCEHQTRNKNDNLAFYKSHVTSSSSWSRALDVWNHVWNRNSDSFDQSQLPSFRCTCIRTGPDHNFTSLEIASAVGGTINDHLMFPVKMKEFDIEVVVKINTDQMYFGIRLNKQSLFRRNITHFGPTALRATISAALVRASGPLAVGDIVVDPMCGSASIPIEGGFNFKDAVFIGGDLHEMAVDRSRLNLDEHRNNVTPSSQTLSNVDIVAWDVTRLPLRSCSVDMFVTDLPFGKRCGSRYDNRTLYPAAMREMARCARPGVGRAIVLTFDKNSMFKVCTKYEWIQLVFEIVLDVGYV